MRKTRLSEYSNARHNKTVKNFNGYFSKIFNRFLSIRLLKVAEEWGYFLKYWKFYS